MPKVLVVCFSRTGFTQRLAEDIAARCGADVEILRDVRSRTGVFGYLRSAREALKQRLIDIEPPRFDPAVYDVVLIGTPVWASHVSSPVRAYVTAQRDRFKRVAFFCTQGGSGAPKVLAELETLCGLKPLATLVANDADIKAGRISEAVGRFVAEATR